MARDSVALLMQHRGEGLEFMQVDGLFSWSCSNLVDHLKECISMEQVLVVEPAESSRSPWRFRFPFIDDANPGEGETALNHVFAGTMAKTLSQICTVESPAPSLEPCLTPSSTSLLTKGTSKQNLEKYLPPGVVHVASASIGTLVSSIVRVPADTLKHRVQAYMHTNVFEAFRSVVTAEGVGGLYKGFWPTLMRDVPEIVIQFGVYEKLRAVVQEKRKVTKLTTPEHLLLGAFAGAIAATFSMPLDLVKTRQQCGTKQAIPFIIASVIKENGVAGLFSGLGARTIHVSLMSALFFGLFEYCKLVIKPHRTGQDKLLMPKIWNKRRDKVWKRQFVRQ